MSDKLQEVMKLLEQVEEAPDGIGADAKSALSKEELLRELMERDKDEVLVGEQAAMAEYSIMLNQWDALVADYERRDAQEAAEAAKAAEEAGGKA